MRTSRVSAFALVTTALAACGGGVDSDEQARRAYLGLDGAVRSSLQLGLDGFNAAHSANIDPQVAHGARAGTLTVTGQVDQGASANKGMRLQVGLDAWDDGDVSVAEGKSIRVVYDTGADAANQPDLTMQLKGIPDGTLDGSLHSGTIHLSGDLDGDVVLDLTFHGTLAPGKDGAVVRAPGTTHVTGTATNEGGGSYAVDLTL
jgi:hypothetical protein